MYYCDLYFHYCSELHFIQLNCFVNIAASPGKVKQKFFVSNIAPKLKVIRQQIINESHPVVQQLVEEYDYDLDASIKAVQLCGTKQRAMDYLARREGDSEDEEPCAMLLEPPIQERYEYSVF